MLCVGDVLLSFVFLLVGLCLCIVHFSFRHADPTAMQRTGPSNSEEALHSAQADYPALIHNNAPMRRSLPSRKQSPVELRRPVPVERILFDGRTSPSQASHTFLGIAAVLSFTPYQRRPVPGERILLDRRISLPEPACLGSGILLTIYTMQRNCSQPSAADPGSISGLTRNSDHPVHMAHHPSGRDHHQNGCQRMQSSSGQCGNCAAV